MHFKNTVLVKLAYMNSMDICSTLIKIIQINWKHHLQKIRKVSLAVFRQGHIELVLT